jgi:hypothetical protein
MYKEPDKIDYPESDPDYYLKKFMPIWKQYMLFLKIFVVVLIFICILIPYILIPYFNFNPDPEYKEYVWYGFIAFMVICALISFYFFYKLRCPKCNSYPVGGMFPLTGKCPRCGVRLKNRLVSDDKARIIKISMIAILVVGMLGCLYSMFNPFKSLTVGCAPKMETEIVLEPDISSAILSPDAAIADTIAAIEARLQAIGLKGAIVKKQDDGLIVVQLPKVEDIEQVASLITGRAEFDLREVVVDKNGQPVLDDEGNEQWVVAKAVGSDGQETELTGKYLKPNAQVVLMPQTNEPEVAFEWNEEGAILFEQITQRNVDKPLGIFLDDKLISAPTVRAVIKDKGVITGLKLDEAQTLAIQLNSGALPVSLRVVRIESIAGD